MVKLYRVILPVKNIEEASKFYSTVLKMPGKRVSPGRHYFDCGGTILACYDPIADGDDMDQGWFMHKNQYLYFSVNDIEETYRLLQKAGATIESGIEKMPWGEVILYARDSFGNPISFVESGTLFTG